MMWFISHRDRQKAAISGAILPFRVSFFLLTLFHSESFQLSSQTKLGRFRTTAGVSAVVAAATIVNNNGDNNHEPDLFDYFDPLLSPHAYPNGVSPKHQPDQNYKRDDDDDANVSDRGYNPLRLNLFSEVTTPTTRSKPAAASQSSSPSLQRNRLEIDPSTVFDPTLSPHMYPMGTPSVITGDDESLPRRPRIGVLLMDHGSRNLESNERLHELARLYQETVDSHVVVQAAHMELATPSIPEGLASLMQAGVDEIICHPFFLSPLGRHVNEDIPAIVQNAIRNLDIQVPVCTTNAVGSNTKLMLNAIHTLVQESSSTILRHNSKLN